MPDYEAIKARVQELGDKAWDTKAIEDWFKKVSAKGIPKKKLNREGILANKQQILDRVQQKAEECNFLSHS